MDSDCDCRGQCEARNNCAGFTYLPNMGVCYLKNYLIGSSTFVWRHDRVTGFVGMLRVRAATPIPSTQVFGTAELLPQVSNHDSKSWHCAYFLYCAGDGFYKCATQGGLCACNGLARFGAGNVWTNPRHVETNASVLHIY